MTKALDSFDAEYCGYNPERHGPLEEYFKKYDGWSACPLFSGVDLFYQLRDEAWLLPDFSVLRLMWNVGRGDEHFIVVEDYMLMGASANFHGGRPGIHDPKEIIGLDDSPYWEIQNIAVRGCPTMVSDAQDALAAWKKRQVE
jgi:hypothetical protein